MTLLYTGAEIEDRWEDVVELYRPHTDDHVLMFHDAHMLLTYSRAADQARVDSAMG